MQLALKRLSPREAYDRIFRIRRAFQVPIFSKGGLETAVNNRSSSQCSLSHTILPKEEWTKDEDVCHLSGRRFSVGFRC